MYINYKHIQSLYTVITYVYTLIMARIHTEWQTVIGYLLFCGMTQLKPIWVCSLNL